VYAAIAFVILQLVDMVAQPLHFPEWTKGFIIVLLCIGFVISIFVSWVYDITPSGVKKTNPISAVKHIDQTSKSISSGWKIATYISVVIITTLIAFNFIGKRNLNTDISKLEKSIAVLPFRNDSSSDSTTYFINGLMDEILTNLQKIGAFSRVLSRTSTEQYRGSAIPTIPEIAKKLNVSYVVEGSGQKYGNKFVLRLQLITGRNERNLWAKSYNREIKQTTDIISVQSEIAQSIASELKATITPEEKQLINKIPTTNLTAYDFYQQGREEHTKYWINNSNRASLQKAEDFYHKALKYDSTFAQAYSGLARVYWDKHSSAKEYFSENYMDSVLILSNIAITRDYHLSESYTLRGRYYSEIGKPEQAIEEYDKAIKLNPNDWMAYREKALFYSNNDFVQCIEYRQKAASINRGPELPSLLGEIGDAYFDAGFPDKAKYYYQEALALNGNEAKYFNGLAWAEFSLGNFEEALKLSKKANEIDSIYLGDLIWYSTLSGHNDEAYICAKKLVEYYEKSGELNLQESHRVGYAFWKAGKIKEAEYYFNEQIDYSNRSIELKRSWAQKLYTYYDLAGVYAFRGEKDKAYKNLRIFNQIQRVPFWMTMFIKTDPLFDNIRNEPEFQQIVRDVEAKYQAEHERVRKWLEETGQL
jgi:TolB-like protein/Tfp pilus assembly protein PilF